MLSLQSDRIIKQSRSRLMVFLNGPMVILWQSGERTLAPNLNQRARADEFFNTLMQTCLADMQEISRGRCPCKIVQDVAKKTRYVVFFFLDVLFGLMGTVRKMCVGFAYKLSLWFASSSQAFILLIWNWTYGVSGKLAFCKMARNEITGIKSNASDSTL